MKGMPSPKMFVPESVEQLAAPIEVRRFIEEQTDRDFEEFGEIELVAMIEQLVRSPELKLKENHDLADAVCKYFGELETKLRGRITTPHETAGGHLTTLH